VHAAKCTAKYREQCILIFQWTGFRATACALTGDIDETVPLPHGETNLPN